MKFSFFWFENQEMVVASPSFKREAKRFLTPLFEKTVYKYFDKSLLIVQKEYLSILQSDGKTMLLNEVHMNLKPIGQLFTFRLSYRGKQGRLIQPWDIVEKGSFEFEIMDFPNEEQLLSIQDSWSEVVKDITTSRLIDDRFRFPFQEKRTCMPPDIKLRIKTTAEGEVLEEILGRAMVEWNEQIAVLTTKNSGLIHDLWFDKAIQKEKVIVIDLGSSSEAGILHLLQALEKSDLMINKVILE